MKGPSCRFYPTCSSYGIEAIKRFGAFKGTYLTIIRISKCHPFHPGGVDYVPPKETKDKNKQIIKNKGDDISEAEH